MPHELPLLSSAIRTLPSSRHGYPGYLNGRDRTLNLQRPFPGQSGAGNTDRLMIGKLDAGTDPPRRTQRNAPPAAAGGALVRTAVYVSGRVLRQNGCRCRASSRHRHEHDQAARAPDRRTEAAHPRVRPRSAASAARHSLCPILVPNGPGTLTHGPRALRYSDGRRAWPAARACR